MFPNINEGINCNAFLWLRCLPPEPSAIYNMKLAKASLCLVSSQYAILFSQSLINADIFIPLW